MEQAQEIKEYNGERYEKIRVKVETAQRGFKGYVYKPQREDGYRLSDYLNTYDRSFLCLTDVEVHDRGQDHRVADRQPFVAVAMDSITYVTPIQTATMQ